MVGPRGALSPFQRRPTGSKAYLESHSCTEGPRWGHSGAVPVLRRHRAREAQRSLPKTAQVWLCSPPPPTRHGQCRRGSQVTFSKGDPSLTKCCNHHDRCYETCGKSKNDCDEEFQYCLSKICREVQKTLGLAQHVQGEDGLAEWG